MLAFSTVFVRALVLGVVKLPICNFVPLNHKIKSIIWDVIFKIFCYQTTTIFCNQAVARWYFFLKNSFLLSLTYFILFLILLISLSLSLSLSLSYYCLSPLLGYIILLCRYIILI